MYANFYKTNGWNNERRTLHANCLLFLETLVHIPLDALFNKCVIIKIVVDF